MTEWSNKRLHTDALTRAGESPRAPTRAAVAALQSGDPGWLHIP